VGSGDDCVSTAPGLKRSNEFVDRLMPPRPAPIQAADVRSGPLLCLHLGDDPIEIVLLLAKLAAARLTSQ
jgi:hypothetical protein